MNPRIPAALARLKARAASLARESRGTAAVMFALSIIPLIGIAGLAIDYGFMLNVKAKLDQAADAAAIAGSTAAQAYLVAATGIGDYTVPAVASGQAQATAQFNANLGPLPTGTLSTPTPQIVRNGPTLTTTVSYSFQMKPFVMGLLGTQQETVTGTSTSTVTMPTYINVYIVIDNSESMGIGATAADQSIVYSATGNCAVACHYTGTETTAHNRGASLRIDVAKQAVAASLATIPSGSNYKVAVYTMSNSLVKVFSLSNDIAAATRAVNTIDLANDNYDGGTNTTYALTKLYQALPATGSGLTPGTAQGIVMLITDAVQDSLVKYASGGSFADGNDPNFVPYSPCNPSVCQYNTDFRVYFESFDPTLCTPIKNAGYTLMTLDVQYLIPPLSLQGGGVAFQNAFSYIQTYLLSSIQTRMAQCATSSAYAYTANTPAQIAAATTAMFNAVPIASAARLSQ